MIDRNPELARQAVFLELLRQAGLPQPHREFQFDSSRRWRFDYAWPQHLVALEQHGGIWRKGGGAHQGAGHLRDMEKSNAAQLQGWVVFQVTPKQLCTPETIAMLRDVFSLRKPAESDTLISRD